MDDRFDKFNELLAASERRIDRTNEMVHELSCAVKSMADTMSDISNKYVAHINDISACRDDVVKQNGQLIELLTKVRGDYESERKRYDSVMSALLSKQSTQINCK